MNAIIWAATLLIVVPAVAAISVIWGLAWIFGVFRPQLRRINREDENAYHALMSLDSMTPAEHRAELIFWGRPNQYKDGKLIEMTPAEHRAELAFWARPNQYKDGKLIE